MNGFGKLDNWLINESLRYFQHLLLFKVEAVKAFLSNHRIDVGLSIESSGVFMRIPWDEKSRSNSPVSVDSLSTLASAYFEAHVEMSRRNVTCPANKDRGSLPSGIVDGAQLPQYAETRSVFEQLVSMFWCYKAFSGEFLNFA